MKTIWAHSGLSVHQRAFHLCLQLSPIRVITVRAKQPRMQHKWKNDPPSSFFRLPIYRFPLADTWRPSHVQSWQTVRSSLIFPHTDFPLSHHYSEIKRRSFVMLFPLEMLQIFHAHWNPPIEGAPRLVGWKVQLYRLFLLLNFNILEKNDQFLTEINKMMEFVHDFNRFTTPDPYFGNMNICLPSLTNHVALLGM